MSSTDNGPEAADQPVAVADEDWSTKKVTPIARLAAALVASNFSFAMAVMVPLQLVLTLHLTRLAHGGDATTAFGIVTGFGALVGMIANPIGGWLSDRTRLRFGRRRTWIVAGAVFGSAAVIGVSFATQVWQVVVVWCCVTAIFNFQMAATVGLLADQVPPKRRGGVSGILGLAGIGAPLFGIAAINAFPAGSARQWQILAVATVAFALIAALLIREGRTEAPRPAGRQSIATVVQSFWISPRRHPAYWRAWIVRILLTCTLAASGYNAFYLMQRFGYSPDDVGGIVLQISSATIVGLAIAAVGGGFISDAVKRQKPFVMGAGVMAAVALVGLAFAPSVGFVFAAHIVLGVGSGLFLSIDTALCVRMLPSAADAGRDMGMINIANTLPQSLVPFMAPFLLSLGGYHALYGLLAVFGLVGAFVVRRLPEIGQEHSTSPKISPITRALPSES
jgi:MFS family permease